MSQSDLSFIFSRRIDGSFNDGGWMVCYNMSTYYHKRKNGIQRVGNPAVASLPNLVLQLLFVMVLSRILMIALKPLRQPGIIANIIAGVIVGPSVIGGSPFFTKYLIPFRNMLSLETFGNLGVVYYMFLVGLELDFKPAIRAGKRALSVALAGIVVAVPIGWALHYFLLLKHFPQVSKDKPTKNGPIFWGIALATTSFTELTKILADLKLLNSEIGRLALSAAVISDLCSWFLLLLAMATINEHPKVVVASTMAFIAFCVFVLRPALLRIMPYDYTNTKQNRKSSSSSSSNIISNNHKELHVCFVLAVVVLFGLITDVCGSHSIVGPFVLGVILPKGELKNMLVERIQHFVSMLMMPLFFLTIGLRTNWRYILHDEGLHEDQYYPETNIKRVVGVIAVAFATKMISTFVTALINKLSTWDSLVLGVLMNTKGLLSLIILASAKDLKALDNRSFAVMMFAIWVMTAPVGPFLAFTYKSARRSSDYKIRNIQSVGAETELKILICTHTSSQVSSMIDLIEASNPSAQSPICIFAVQLVELTGHASAMLIVHDACKANTYQAVNESQFEYFTSNDSFVNYAKERKNVSAQQLITVSAYNTMHEDICNLAEDKFVNLIILPFHMQTTMDGAMEDSNPSWKSVNNNVVSNAPCSVGIFVDRGFSIAQIMESNDGASSTDCHHHAMFFIGGADDREALTYAQRMAGHSRVKLKVVRFLVIPSYTKDDDKNNNNNKDNNNSNEMEDTRREKQLDDLLVDEFRLKSMHNPSIQYLEEMVNSWEETLNIINSMDGEYDLYVVGRRHASTSPSTWFLDDRSSDDHDELGPLGDALVITSSFTINTSILIVQQGVDVHELETNHGSEI